MVFSSLTFLFIFLPITLLLYFIIPKKHTHARNFVLLIMSLLFYSWGEPKYILLMIISVILNYALGLLIGKYKSKKTIILIISIILNIGLLIYFKYIGLFLNTFNSLFDTDLIIPKIALPIGISFYTFQILSYVIDVYRDEIKPQKNILTLATYVALFPQLIAGPIVRYQTIEEELDSRNETFSNFTKGLRRFIIGLSKKVIIANNVALFIDSIVSRDITSYGTVIVWLAILSYTLQIYFDFSGYSDMAIGLGKMFGFNFLENFNYPYVASSITDFWRRWHISLSTWFRDYVYIPLGGNRGSKIKWIRNILIVWLLTGFWHGASWNFALWGIYYGVVLLLEKLVLGKIINKLPKILQHLYTIIFIMIGWLIFRIEDISVIWKCLKIMFIYKPSDFTDLLYNNMKIIPSILYIALGIFFSTPLIRNVYIKISNMNKRLYNYMIDVLIFGLFILSIVYLLSTTYNPFIYFRF